MVSDYFVADNGVKQSAVLSLFCVYIDDLLLLLFKAGIGSNYNIGFNFVGALAYANDIVLINCTNSCQLQLYVNF